LEEEEPDFPYKLSLQATLTDLARIREFVEKAVLASGCAPDDASMLVLAVDEAVTNTIVHGYASRGGLVEVAVGQQDKKTIVRLRDVAPPFDPTTVPSPDLSLPLDRRPPGGLGIYLMHKIADTVTYRARPGGGNEITLVKQQANLGSRA
jgi:serine/threonine-protein kinase RsbW